MSLSLMARLIDRQLWAQARLCESRGRSAHYRRRLEREIASLQERIAELRPRRIRVQHDHEFEPVAQRRDGVY